MSEIKVNSVVNSTGDNDSGLDLSTNDQVIIKTANTTALTVDSSQGVTVAGAFTSRGIDDNADHNAITIDSNEDITILKQGYATTSLNFSNTNQGVMGAIKYDHASGRMLFDVHSAERMRIDASGNLLVNTTTERGKLTVLHNSNDTATPTLYLSNDGGSSVWVSLGNSSGGIYGSISRSGSSVSYNTTSDHRLKENVDYTFDGTTRLKQLKPARFNFIADADTTVDGFLAHEVQSVVPEAITGTHNEVDDDGNAVMQGIDQSKLVPLLVKTIQELEARITALENE